MVSCFFHRTNRLWAINLSFPDSQCLAGRQNNRNFNLKCQLTLIWLILIGSLLSQPIHAQQIDPYQQQADQLITQLYHTLQRKPIWDTTARLVFFSEQFLGKPYLLGALGEGLLGDYDQAPLYRIDAFDCQTYVDTVLGLTLATNPAAFQERINQVRYQDSLIKFTHRNHFTDLDWNTNNQKKGFLKDITTSLHNQNRQSVVRMAHALINKPGWYDHMSLQSIRLNHASPAERAKRLISLKQEGRRLPQTLASMTYIPFSVLFDEKGHANTYLFAQLPHGAILEIVRPNWNPQPSIGTHLNVSHLGFVIRKNDLLFFRQASSIYGKVIDVPLIDYLREAQKNATIRGINLQVVPTSFKIRPNDKP